MEDFPLLPLTTAWCVNLNEFYCNLYSTNHAHLTLKPWCILVFLIKDIKVLITCGIFYLTRPFLW